MRHQNVLSEAVMFNDGLYLITNFFFVKSLIGDPETHRHDLDGNDADLVINTTTPDAGGGLQLLEKIHIRVEADANPVDEDNRELGTRGMRTMPVGEVPDGRSLTTE